MSIFIKIHSVVTECSAYKGANKQTKNLIQQNPMIILEKILDFTPFNFYQIGYILSRDSYHTNIRHSYRRHFLMTNES